LELAMAAFTAAQTQNNEAAQETDATAQALTNLENK
jgi:hypothetical protein